MVRKTMCLGFRQVSLLVISVALLGRAAHGGDDFAAFDINEDGFLSGKEVKLLLLLDTNQDDEVTRQEYETELARERGRVGGNEEGTFVELDKNEDGRLSGNEIGPYAELDVNRDGRVTRDEFLAGGANGNDSVKPLAAFAIEKLVPEIQRMFSEIDGNADGRLSGTEIAGYEVYDQDGDDRVTQQEFTEGLLIATLAARLDQPIPASIDGPDAVRALVRSLQLKSSQPLMDAISVDLRSQVDSIILDYTLRLFHQELGEVNAPKESDVRRAADSTDKDARWVTNLKFERGELELVVQIFEGQFSGFDFKGELIDDVGPRMFADIMEQESVGRDFAKFYAPACVQMIQQILANSDQAAYASMHPQIQEQIEFETFVSVFQFIRDHVGQQSQIELEGMRCEVGEEKNDGSLTLTHRVSGNAGSLDIKQQLQFVGMKAHFVSISAAPPENAEVMIPKVPSDWLNTITKEGISFHMPGKPTSSTVGEGVQQYKLDATELDCRFVAQHFHSEADLQAESEKLFSALNESVGENLKAELVESKPAPWKTFPGRIAVFQVDETTVHIRRDIAIGPKLISFIWHGERDSAERREQLCMPFLMNVEFTSKALPAVNSPKPPAPPRTDDDVTPPPAAPGTDDDVPPPPVAPGPGSSKIPAPPRVD
jgi:hypothetical protein